MKLKPCYQLLLLVFFVLGVYYPSLFIPFNSLDDQLLVQQLMNQDGFTLSRHFSPGGTYDYFRPLLTLTFEVDKYVGGLEEPFMHLVNILLHTLNTVLIYLLTRRISFFIGREPGWSPFLAAGLFALHPLNTEAVNWIMGRTDLLAGFFVFLMLLLFVNALDKRSILWAIGSALALFLGALCKETALFVVPGVCFLLCCRPVSGPDSWRPRWLIPGFYGLAIVGYFALRWGAFTVDRGIENTTAIATKIGEGTIGVAASVGTETFTLLNVFWSLLKASGFYVTKLFQPLPLNFAINRLDNFYILPGAVLVCTLLVLVWRHQFLSGWFLVSASIAVSALFVVLTRLAWTPIAERYMYIPCGVFSVALVQVIALRLKSSVWQKILPVLVLLLFGVAAQATSSRNLVWQDNLTLYQDAVRQSPDFAPAKNQLALALQKHGRAEEAAEILANNEIQDGGVAALNGAVVLAEGGDYAAAKSDLISRLTDAGSYQKVNILEMLVRLTAKYTKEIDDEELKRANQREMVGWLEQIREISPTGFNYYRVGRMQMFLGNKVAAKVAFAAAAKRFPENSIYKKPAAKLARDLAE